MSEWLTTGQMIDKLKVGEVAESNDHLTAWYNEMKALKFKTEEGVESYKFVIDEMDYKKERKWRILPKYVSLEEAMKAYKEGKTIVSHAGELGFIPAERRFNIEDEVFSVASERISHGKWTIED